MHHFIYSRSNSYYYQLVLVVNLLWVYEWSTSSPPCLGCPGPFSKFYQHAAYYFNKNKICPLLLAINNWFKEIDIVNPMIRGLQNSMQSIKTDSMGMKSIIHVAIETREIDILKSLIDNAGNLFKHTFDDKGRNPLSYAICIGYIEGVQLLLDNFPASEFKRDQDENGSFPIHQAAKKGHLEIIKMLTLSVCLLNNKQQNILHVAAEAGNANVVYYLLKRQDHFEELLNIGDADGNTPLHLAAKGCWIYTMRCLMRRKQIDCNSINKELRTARDEFKMSSKYSTADEILRMEIKTVEMLFWIKCGDIRYYFGKKEGKECNGNEVNKEEGKKQANVKTPSRIDSSTVNILLVVATLIVSVTYTTTFNPPGGFHEKDGTPSLIHSYDFLFFMDLNSAACYCALISAILLLASPLVESMSFKAHCQDAESRLDIFSFLGAPIDEFRICKGFDFDYTTPILYGVSSIYT